MLSELGHGYDTDWRAASGTGHHEKAGSQEGERQLEKVGHASRVVQTLRAHEDTAGRPGPVDTSLMFFVPLIQAPQERPSQAGTHLREL